MAKEKAEAKPAAAEDGSTRQGFRNRAAKANQELADKMQKLIEAQSAEANARTAQGLDDDALAEYHKGTSTDAGSKAEASPKYGEEGYVARTGPANVPGVSFGGGTGVSDVSHVTEPGSGINQSEPEPRLSASAGTTGTTVRRSTGSK